MPSKPSSRILFLLHRNLFRLVFFSLRVFVFRALTLQVILYQQLQPKIMGPDWFVLLSTDFSVCEWEAVKVIKVSCKFSKVLRSCLWRKLKKSSLKWPARASGFFDASFRERSDHLKYVCGSQAILKGFFKNITLSSKTRMKVNA